MNTQPCLYPYTGQCLARKGYECFLLCSLRAFRGFLLTYMRRDRLTGQMAGTDFQQIHIATCAFTDNCCCHGIRNHKFIWTFNFYDLAWVMTGGGPAEATQTTPIYALQERRSAVARMGEGSAINHDSICDSNYILQQFISY